MINSLQNQIYFLNQKFKIHAIHFFLPLQCLFQNKIKSKKKTKLQTAISEQSLAPYLRCNVQVKKRQIMASINNTCM